MKNIKLGLNKITFLLLLVYMLVGTGITYAYFAFSYENTSTIVGNVVAVDADLTVERVVGTDEKLVPMTDAALGNALVGSENGACIDDLGNLSCQVYKITLTNNASRLQHLVGSIELYPKKGTNSAYSNLKWQELTDEDSVKDGSIINGMNKSILVSGLTMESKETKTWYVGVWLSEIDANQKNIDKGEFQGTVTFEVIDSLTEGVVGNFYNDFTEKVMMKNAKSDVGIDFSKTSEQSGTNGIYIRNGTQDDTYPIYYYRGKVDNNLVFADFCWKIVRTTETGGLKLIYNGIPTETGGSVSCNNTGEDSQIGTSAFNTNYNSPTYVGYMYGTPHARSGKDMTNDTTEYVYGNDVSYSNGTYTLTDGTVSGVYSTLYNGGLNNNHYTCFNTGTTCTNVYYVYYTEETKVYYMTLTEGKKIENILDEGLNYNTTSSTIKGDAQTSGSLDHWYATKIENSYGYYVEDTVWCNDRTIVKLNGWDPDGGTTSDHLRFGTWNRIVTLSKPDLACARELDSFTRDAENGNGDLDYPVGLLTGDELMLAGGGMWTGKENSEYYLYSGVRYWSSSPSRFINSYVDKFLVSSSGTLSHYSVDNLLGVRPSISLKHGFTIANNNADGSVDKPYIVETN